MPLALENEGAERMYLMPSHCHLSWKRTSGETLHLLPRHGKPSTFYEWFSQRTIKILSFLPVYIAVVVTLTLLVQIFGVPFVFKGGW